MLNLSIVCQEYAHNISIRGGCWLYNAGLLESHSSVNYVVAQLMASQNAKGIVDQFGGEVYSHFTPICAGFN